MKCSSCNSEIAPSRFCPFCGFELEAIGSGVSSFQWRNTVEKKDISWRSTIFIFSLICLVKITELFLITRGPAGDQNTNSYLEMLLTDSFAFVTFAMLIAAPIACISFAIKRRGFRRVLVGVSLFIYSFYLLHDIIKLLNFV